MAILKGAMSYQRFRINFKADLNPDQILEKLKLFKFRPLHERGFDQESIGWCSYLNEYDEDRALVVKDILYDEKIVLTLRHDSIVLPKPLLKSLIKKSVVSYYRDHNKWPDRTTKKEIEQAETQALRARVLPKIRIIEAILDIKSQELRIFTRSKGSIDRFLDLFNNTFLEKPLHRDFAHEAYWFAQSQSLPEALNAYTHIPLFAPPVRIDVQ